MKFIKSTILLFLLFQIHHAIGQNMMRFDHITQNDGLPSDHVNQILQDSDGLMWFATYNGLASYDGYRFNTYNYSPNDTLSISHDNVLSICEQSSRYIWVGTTNGFCRFDKEQEVFKRFNSSTVGQISQSSIRKLDIDNQDNLWMATNVGLVFYNIKKDVVKGYITQNGVNSIRSSSVNDVYVDKNHKVWVATDKGLDLFDPELESFAHILDGFFVKLTACNDGVMAITRDFIRYISPSVNEIDFTKVYFERNADNYVVTDVLINYQGADWYAIRDNGTYCFSNRDDSYTVFKYDKYDNKSINSNVPQCIYRDRNDNLWIGTFDGGVNFYSPHKKKFRNIQDNFKDDGLQNNYVKTIYEDRDGDIWVGTKVGGMLSKFDRKTHTFTHYKHDPNNPESISDDYIFSIVDAQPGYLWVGTMNGGLNLFNKKTGKSIHIKHDPNDEYSISSNNIRSLIVDSGKLWIAGHQKGVDVFDIKTRKKFKNFQFSLDDKNTISSNGVVSILRDSYNQLWIATTFGLNRYDREKNQFVRYYHVENDSTSLSDNIIHCIVEDKEHYLWVGTKNGLNKYNPHTDSFKVYNTNNGLPTNSIYGISIDSHGYVWMSTNVGIVRFNYYTNESKLFTDEDGLSNNEFAPSVFTTTKGGDVFFGGNKGFTYFKPDDIIINPNKPDVIFTDFKVLNESVRPGNDNPILHQSINTAAEVNLFYDDKVFSIEFSALNYISPDRNTFAYMLDGFDTDWHFTENSHSATYTNINPGKYTFKVKASNNDGIWNEKGRSLIINVIPAWWDTLFFKITVVLFLLFVIILLFQLRQRVYRIQTATLEEKVKERTENLNRANLELNAQKEEILKQHNEIQDKKEQLEKETQKLAVLNRFGQDLINILSLTEINQVIFDYVKTLLDVPVFGIAIYNQEQNCLEFPSYFEDGLPVKSLAVPLEDKKSMAVWCYKHQEVIFSNDFKNDYHHYVEDYYFPNAVLPESVMYLALSVKGKRIGTMGALSYKKNAYTEGDLVTLQTLASYISIALDNANAYRIVSSQNKELEEQHTLLEKQVKVRTRELEAAKSKAEESDRLKTSFLANMSHEIRTPLNAIVGFSECLALQDLTEAEKEHMSGIIRLNSDSLLQIISDIIDFSKIEAGQMKIAKFNVDIDNLLQELNHTYTFHLNAIGKSGELQTKVVKSGLKTKPVLFTDPFRLKQIIRNLIDNAIKFTTKGSIEFGYKGIKDNCLIFYVKDTGIGIAKENLNVIFDRFRKIEDDISNLYRGTGLGLSITKYLTELLDGEIWVESEVGKGTEFIFTMPELIVDHEEQLKTPAGKKNQLPDWSDKKVLVVEDEESNYIVLEHMLKNTRINIVWAKDGAEAMQLFNDNIKDLDLVLLDIKLPVKDGFEVVKEIRQEKNSIPVIAQTAFAMANEETIIRECGFDDYIAKPINRDLLVDKISLYIS